ncbi:MAG: hypothetical protein CFE31_06465 [Rhizobiales bacterium PAR1]|nr:MAG: hypothetical protein CFE31_06465 [Rhizobiales bacterium PAR1]
MLWRITAAITAIYFMHGAEASRQDAARVASEVAVEAPRALVAACLDKAELCQQVLRHAAGGPQSEPPAHTGKISAVTSLKTPPTPVTAVEFPLPPIRPAMLHPRKGT